jgi:5-carboxymethyl-2-hydroxymuconate isomerase
MLIIAGTGVNPERPQTPGVDSSATNKRRNKRHVETHIKSETPMPHIIVEYSGNLDDGLDIRALVDDLHQCAIDSRVADVAAIRTRAERRDVFKVADGDPANAFVHIVARLRIGRSEEQRRALADALLAVTDRQLQRADKTHPLAITVEIEEIDNITARRNTIRSALQRTA